MALEMKQTQCNKEHACATHLIKDPTRIVHSFCHVNTVHIVVLYAKRNRRLK